MYLFWLCLINIYIYIYRVCMINDADLEIFNSVDS